MDQYSDFTDIPEPEIVDHMPQVEQPGAFFRDRHVWSFTTIEELLRRFSPAERLILYALTILIGISGVILVAGVNRAISIEVPAHGGSLSEGETGPARFINPILALSQADEDLAMVIYSGLTRSLPNGSYVPDLADHYDISADGTTYTFYIRKNATFHDGTPVTASDILFTVASAQNPDIKSPHRADWEGVTASSPDPYTVVFTLPHAYAPFIENTTLGILPKARWQNVSAEEFPFSPLNTHPIGSGPYKITGVKTDSTGAATRYDLAPFNHYVLGTPFVSRLSFLFFPNEDALVKAFNMHEVDAVAGISPTDLPLLKRTDVSAVEAPLPRVFGVFFNENKNAALADASAREALNAAVDKKALVDTVLGGYGAVLDGPIPPGILGAPAPTEPTPVVKAFAPMSTTSASELNAQTARQILTEGGWSFGSSTLTWTKKKTTLTFKLATADEPELVATANALADDWRAAGIDVNVQVYPLSDFNNSVLRPRNYDAILFGEVVGRSADLFAFWHSSQRNDPGLNLAMYTNSKVDSLLSSARASTNKEERDSLYAQFATLVEKDQPAIFLYSPEFIYIVPKGIENIEIGALTTPAERFLNVYQWYSDTQRVWSFFTDKTDSIQE